VEEASKHTSEELEVCNQKKREFATKKKGGAGIE